MYTERHRGGRDRVGRSGQSRPKFSPRCARQGRSVGPSRPDFFAALRAVRVGRSGRPGPIMFRRAARAYGLQTTCSLITRGAAIAGSLSEFKSPTAEQLQVVTTPAVGTSAPALDSVQSSALSSPAGPDTRKRYMMDTPAGGWPAYSEALADSESKRPRQGPGATRLMTDKKMSPVRSMRDMDDPELQD